MYRSPGCFSMLASYRAPATHHIPGWLGKVIFSPKTQKYFSQPGSDTCMQNKAHFTSFEHVFHGILILNDVESNYNEDNSFSGFILPISIGNYSYREEFAYRGWKLFPLEKSKNSSPEKYFQEKWLSYRHGIQHSITCLESIWSTEIPCQKQSFRSEDTYVPADMSCSWLWLCLNWFPCDIA